MLGRDDAQRGIKGRIALRHVGEPRIRGRRRAMSIIRCRHAGSNRPLATHSGPSSPTLNCSLHIYSYSTFLIRTSYLAMTAISIANKTALITGGGSGIGLGCAVALAREGCRVAIAGRREDVLKQAAATWSG
jgi:hypothetical protein